jgi:LmbE family N-acetylglucosaminyl deacetylase
MGSQDLGDAMIDGDQRVLVVAAHPDDEILGCGGTVARFVDAGADISVVIGSAGREGVSTPGLDTAAALRELGVSSLKSLGLSDQGLDVLRLADIVTQLEAVVRAFQPTIVLTHHRGDVNQDHEAVFKAVLVATRPPESCVQQVYSFDTASSTEWGFPRNFHPDTWVDISSTLDRKLAAMSHYAAELRDYPHPRSIEALVARAHARGNECCLDAAEVFATVRRIVPR